MTCIHPDIESIARLSMFYLHGNKVWENINFIHNSHVLLDMLPLLLPESNTYHPKSIADHIKGNLTHSDHERNKDPTLVTSNLTQMEGARCVIENRIFTIVVSTKPHVVTLHPKESCLCMSVYSAVYPQVHTRLAYDLIECNNDSSMT